jgi:hypothetical protein
VGTGRALPAIAELLPPSPVAAPFGLLLIFKNMPEASTIGETLAMFLGTSSFWAWLMISSIMIVLAVLYRRTFLLQLQTGDAPGIAALFILVIFLTIVSLQATPTGDEPHYLLMTQSLLRDGDFDLRNNYEHMDYLEYYPRVIPDAHVTLVGNYWYPVHGIGLPILSAPWFALAGRAGVVVMLTLMSVAGIRIMWSVLQQAGFKGRVTNTSVLVMGFTLPLLSLSGQIFPEVPAFLVVAVTLRAIVAPTLTGWNLATISLGLAWLPWLHPKYITLTAALLLSLAFAHYRRSSIRTLAIPTGLFVLSDLGLIVLSYQWYGVPVPGAQLMASQASFSPYYWLTHIAGHFFIHPWVGLIGVLLDQQSGIFLASPVYILAIPGIILLWHRRRRTLAIACGIVFTAVYLPAGTWGQWHGGFASPARFLTPIVPVLAIGIASMLDAGGTRAWRLLSVLAIPSFLHAYLMMALPRTRYGDPVTQHNFFIALVERHANLDLTGVFPSFLQTGPTTWLTTAAYLLVFIVISIYLVRRGVIRSAGTEPRPKLQMTIRG